MMTPSNTQGDTPTDNSGKTQHRGAVLGTKPGDIDNPRVQCCKCGQWKRHYSVVNGICEYNSFPDAYGYPWCTNCIKKYPEEYETDE